MTDENRPDESDWLKDAFDRALRGENGAAPDAARPAANPFGVTPQPTDPRETGGPVGHNELDLDFETESTVSPQAFLPVVDFDDDATADDNEPDPFAVFSMTEASTPTEPTDVVDIPEATVPIVQPTYTPVPEHAEMTPTEAIDTVDAPTVASPVAEPTPTGSVDGLDSLFSDDKFADAQTRIISAPTPGTETSSPAQSARAGLSGNAVAYGIAAGVTVLLAIGGFVGGSLLGGGFVAEPTPTPTIEPGPTAMQEPGEWKWNELFGGECIDPFPGAWAETFDVVDCATPHSAQLVAVGDLTEFAGAIFPGADQAAAYAQTECSAKGVLDLTKAGAYPNMQVSASYAPSQEQWDAGNTKYYCFVSLTDAAPITGSVAPVATDVTE
ncbi:MAG: septum formation family protein [Microbacteriaceae bacterium]